MVPALYRTFMFPVNFIVSNSTVTRTNILTRANGVMIDYVADIFEFTCVLGFLEQVTNLVKPEAKRVNTRLHSEAGIELKLIESAQIFYALFKLLFS